MRSHIARAVKYLSCLNHLINELRPFVLLFCSGDIKDDGLFFIAEQLFVLGCEASQGFENMRGHFYCLARDIRTILQ
ncbi:hypothetical protein C2L71_10375 [Enteroscipio rubneri]|uniref:Uncharacterized protein n=1 Tax=Enteroscipio rubneri TaxID=2070686 RepID=A0A2K2U9D6_9ACTN|nr:hypothetical protein C2L71_10375 [Enteroscipio rubneri]